MSLAGKRVLVTCGPTWVPIDDVRVISNTSTGEMGQRLATALSREGARVTVLEGPVTNPLDVQDLKIKKYTTYKEFATLLKRELERKFDVVIHAAAVADYQLKKTVKNKLRSGQQLKLNLVPTRKLINDIKKIAPQSFLVGFKLESSQNVRILAAKALSLFKSANCDLVVANSFKNHYRGIIINRDRHIVAHGSSRTQLARSLITTLKRTL